MFTKTPPAIKTTAARDALEIHDSIVIKKEAAKPGYKTTEFYKSSALEIIALLAAFGVVGPEDTKILNQMPDAVAGALEMIFKVGGLVVALISQWSYTKSRAEVKGKIIK